MRIGLLEDDVDQAQLVSHWLESAGHHCLHCNTSKDFLRIVLRESFDMLILDWMVPQISGLEVLEKLRDSSRDYTPVLFVTARDKEDDVVRALEAGADDYMAKPLRKQELLARVSALARRARGGRAEDDLPETAPYELDLQQKSISMNGEVITLTHREFDLALFMFRHAGRVVSRSHILEAIWGLQGGDVNTRTVDTHISRLRKKLQFGAASPWHLAAIYQHGYRLERADAAESDDAKN